MAGKIQDPLAVPYPKHRLFVTSHFHFLLHMVSLCVEAISTEWGKQIPWSFKSYIGIFKRKHPRQTKGARAVSHSAWSEIVPAVLNSFCFGLEQKFFLISKLNIMQEESEGGCRLPDCRLDAAFSKVAGR